MQYTQVHTFAYTCARAYICIHTVKFYSAIKENEILSFVGKWAEMETTVK